MKIHIVGPGVVGNATAKMFFRFGYSVVTTDQGEQHDISSDIHFVCVPEAVAIPVVRELRDVGGVVVIRSSVPPGTTDLLSKELQRDIFHNPEFLKEATAEADVVEEQRVVIGTPKTPVNPDFLRVSMDFLETLYRTVGKEVIRCSALESETLKLLNNAYLATLISYWGEAYKLCNVMGLNSHRVARMAVENDSRVQSYGAYRHGPPGYGGKCLPKDLDQILALGERFSVKLPLIEAVKVVNEEMKGERNEQF